MRQMVVLFIHFIATSTLSLANCYFAHDSSGFSRAFFILVASRGA
jgi:hypothetical protein